MIVAITASEVNNPSPRVPPALADFISLQDYQYICSRFRGIESEAFAFGLLISFALCVCITPIACIFCPCFVSCRITSERKRVANELNLTMYRGYPVVEAHEFQGILIHTDRIPGALPTVPTQVAYANQPGAVMVSSEYVQVQPVSQTPVAQVYSVSNPAATKSDTYARPTAVPAVASPPPRPAAVPVAASPPIAAQQPRMMSVRIPDNTHPGQTLRINSPDNTMIDIVIPEGVNAGEDILVPY